MESMATGTRRWNSEPNRMSDESRSVSPRAASALTAKTLLSAPPLTREFFIRDATTVGRELLGKLLIRREGRRLLAGRIVEAEAYLGAVDPASHAYIGRTPRNAVLFGPPGHAYVYFIYGTYYCANVSCMPEGEAEGVLLRAMEPVWGLEAMAEARGLELTRESPESQLRLVSSGPGRMSEALGITRARDNSKDLTSRKSDLWFADDGYRPERIAATPRIGIKMAVEEPLRFVIVGNPYVSARRVR
jgi:DNA-3-methyladenine glycosylase